MKVKELMYWLIMPVMHWVELWREINDILRVHQFAWLSNGKDSCWIKMQS
jgi:hypothetical protein